MGMASVFEQYPNLLNEQYVAEYPFHECWTVVYPEEAYHVLDVAAAILQGEGNFTLIAKLLKRGRRSVENFIMRTLELRELQEDVEEAFLDEVEGKYKNLAKAGDPGAARFFLTTKAKNRGYVTRVESTGKDGTPIEVDEINARTLLSDKLDRLLKRRAEATVDHGVVGEGGGSAPLGLESLGEAGTTGTDRSELVDVDDSGGPGLREDENGSGVGP